MFELMVKQRKSLPSVSVRSLSKVIHFAVLLYIAYDFKDQQQLRAILLRVHDKFDDRMV